MSSVIFAIIAAAALPYALTGAAKLGAFSPKDNHRTRDWQASLEGWRKRAHWAHQNSLEAFPLFAAAMVVGLVAVPSSPWLPILAWAFIGLRVAYGACYIGDWARVRSLVWFAALACPTAVLVIAGLES